MSERKKSTKYARAFYARNPWLRSWQWAKRRCEDPRHRCYGSYGGRGVKFLLTKDEVRRLWERDGAGAMVRPTLDRIESEVHYTFENCRFVEFEQNASTADKRHWRTRTAIKDAEALGEVGL